MAENDIEALAVELEAFLHICPDQDIVFHGDRLLTALRSTTAEPNPAPVDNRVCRICDGGPGNECACTCGMELYDAHPTDSAAKDAEIAAYREALERADSLLTTIVDCPDPVDIAADGGITVFMVMQQSAAWIRTTIARALANRGEATDA